MQLIGMKRDLLFWGPAVVVGSEGSLSLAEMVYNVNSVFARKISDGASVFGGQYLKISNT